MMDFTEENSLLAKLTAKALALVPKGEAVVHVHSDSNPRVEIGELFPQIRLGILDVEVQTVLAQGDQSVVRTYLLARSLDGQSLTLIGERRACKPRVLP